MTKSIYLKLKIQLLYIVHSWISKDEIILCKTKEKMIVFQKKPIQNLICLIQNQKIK